MTELDKKLLKAIESTNPDDENLVNFIFKYLKEMPNKHKESYIEVKKGMFLNVDGDSYQKNRGKYVDWMFKGASIAKQKNTKNYK